MGDSITATTAKATRLWRDVAEVLDVDASVLAQLGEEAEREAARRALDSSQRDQLAQLLANTVDSLRPALAAARDREIDAGSRAAAQRDAVDDAKEKLTGILRWLRSDVAPTRKARPMTQPEPWPLDLSEEVRKADEGHHVNALYRALQESESHPDLARARAEIIGWRNADLSDALVREERMRRQILLRLPDIASAQKLATALGLGPLGGAS
ncbi:MAG: hypothetical protein R3B72_36045 [Polyangiaceae bacterium]